MKCAWNLEKENRNCQYCTVEGCEGRVATKVWSAASLGGLIRIHDKEPSEEDRQADERAKTMNAVTHLCAKGWTLVAPWSNVFKKMRDKIEERMHEICNTRGGRVAKRNMPEYENLRNLLDLVNPFLGISGPTYTESCGIPTTSPKYKLDVKPEQPVEGLGDEAESYWIEAGWSKVMTLGRFKTIANYFYELGCRRTAEMYDDIEYERQRAEEAELSEGLEEEIRKYLLDHNIINHSEEGWKRYAEQVARHFAEWGATHLKQ